MATTVELPAPLTRLRPIRIAGRGLTDTLPATLRSSD